MAKVAKVVKKVAKVAKSDEINKTGQNQPEMASSPPVANFCRPGSPLTGGGGGHLFAGHNHFCVFSILATFGFFSFFVYFSKVISQFPFDGNFIDLEKFHIFGFPIFPWYQSFCNFFL